MQCYVRPQSLNTRRRRGAEKRLCETNCASSKGGAVVGRQKGSAGVFRRAWDDDSGGGFDEKQARGDDEDDAPDESLRFSEWNPLTPRTVMQVPLIPDDLFSELMLPGVERILEIDTQRQSGGDADSGGMSSRRRSDASSDDDFYVTSVFKALHSYARAEMYSSEDTSLSWEKQDKQHKALSVGARAVFGQRVLRHDNLEMEQVGEIAVLVESIVLSVSDTRMTIQLRGVARLQVQRGLDGSLGAPSINRTDSTQPKLVLVKILEDAAISTFEERVKLAELEWSVWTLAKRLAELDMRIKRAELGVKSWSSRADSEDENAENGRDALNANRSLMAGLSGYPESSGFPISAYFLPPMVHALAPKDYDRAIERRDWKQTPSGIRKMWQDRACRFSFAVLDMYQQSERSGSKGGRAERSTESQTQKSHGGDLQQDINDLVTTVNTSTRFVAVEAKLRKREAEQTARLALLTAFMPNSESED